MTELVNATYFIERIGFDKSWSRHLLSSRLEPQGLSNKFRMYKKEEVDELIETIKESMLPKKKHEWDLDDIKNHFGICYTNAQRLAKCDGFPEPIRRIKGEKPSNLKRVWLDSDIKNVRLDDYPDRWVRPGMVLCWVKTKKQAKLLDVEKQFLRGFL
jgi:hypothetical protein